MCEWPLLLLLLPPLLPLLSAAAIIAAAATAPATTNITTATAIATTADTTTIVQYCCCQSCNNHGLVCHSVAPYSAYPQVLCTDRNFPDSNPRSGSQQCSTSFLHPPHPPTPHTPKAPCLPSAPSPQSLLLLLHRPSVSIFLRFVRPDCNSEGCPKVSSF